MSTQRLHKVLHGLRADGSTSAQFASIQQNGAPLPDVSATARGFCASWPDYHMTCVETYELYPHVGPGGQHSSWVLRGTVRCCCAPACGYPADHASGSYGKMSVTPSIEPRQTAHGPAQDYVESRLEQADLGQLAQEGRAAAASTTAASALGKQLSADAGTFDLSSAEIEAHLGVVGTDENGLLSAAGAVAPVLTGTSTTANDYYVVAAFLKLYQRLVFVAYNKLSRDWPQRGVAKPIKLGPRQ